MEGLSSFDDYAMSTMQDFNLEHSFEVSDLTADNISAVSKKNLNGVSHENLVASDNLTDFGNFTDIGNLAAVCGLTITNQSLKIVQVTWKFPGLLGRFRTSSRFSSFCQSIGA